MCMNKEKCADACWVRHLAHLGREEGGAEPRLAGAQHCAAADVWSLLSVIQWTLSKLTFVIFEDLHFKEVNFQ